MYDVFGRCVLDLWGFDDIGHDGFRRVRLYTYFKIVYIIMIRYEYTNTPYNIALLLSVTRVG